MTDKNIREAILDVIDDGPPNNPHSPWLLYEGVTEEPSFAGRSYVVSEVEANTQRLDFADAVIARVKVLARNDVIQREGAL